MKKNTPKDRLKLNRETLQALAASETGQAAGGITTSVRQTICSICISCRPNTCRC